MKCPYCQNEIDFYSKRCSVCNANLDDVLNNNLKNDKLMEANTVYTKKKDYSSVIFGIIILLLALGISILFMYLKLKNSFYLILPIAFLSIVGCSSLFKGLYSFNKKEEYVALFKSSHLLFEFIFLTVVSILFIGIWVYVDYKGFTTTEGYIPSISIPFYIAGIYNFIKGIESLIANREKQDE